MSDAMPPGNRRKTIGILSESVFFEYETLVFQGARRAAEKYDFNLALVMPLDDTRETTHYGIDHAESMESFRDHCRRLKAYLDLFELDGLIYTGWSPKFQGKRGRYLLDALKPIRFVSISGSFDDIPCVIMPGGPYVGQITRHLIQEHGCRGIAYVHTWSEDARVNHYKAAMSEHGIEDERLIVRSRELVGLTDPADRMRRTAAILFDERDVPVDAVIVLNAFDGKFMLEEMLRRGLRVPDDVRLVCCENDPIIQNAKPSVTAIEYPFEALSYAACERLIEQLDGREVPRMTELPTRIFYRDSCGCTINNVRPMRHEPSLEAAVAATDTPSSPADIRSRFPELSAADADDLEQLSARFLDSLANGNGYFLEAFGELLNWQSRERVYEIGRLLERVREAILPFAAADASRYARAEALWYASRLLIRNVESGQLVDDYIRKSDILNKMNHINKELLATRTTAEVQRVLLDSLGSIGIPSFYLFLMDKEQSHSRSQEPKLLFASDQYGNRIDSYPPHYHFTDTIRQFRAEKAARDERFSLIVMPLQAAQEQIGIAWADPGEHETITITGLFDETAKALKGAQMHEELHELVGQLQDEIVLRREKEAQLAYYADVDSLTGLFNRRFFYDSLQRAAREHAAFAVLCIDIDGFKQVNDTLGHDAGDRLLRHLADRLRSLLSDAAFALEHASFGHADMQRHAIFRMGGDEFTVLLRLHGRDEIAELADKLCAALHQPFDLNGSEARVSGSIGIARYPDDASDEERLLKCADLALYQAKAGKNRYRFFSELGVY